MFERRFTQEDEFAIADRLAWSDGSLDEEVCDKYEIDWEYLEQIMKSQGYVFDYSGERWVSTRDVWKD